MKRFVTGGAVLLLAGCAPKTVPLLPVERLGTEVPVQGEAQWLRGGELRVTTPLGESLLWNPTTQNVAATAPFPLPPGVTGKPEHVRWLPSPSGQWLLVTQTRYESRQDADGLWPVAQKRWLLTKEGRCLSAPQPTETPLDSGPLWLPDSSGWVTATHDALITTTRSGEQRRQALPTLTGAAWHRVLVGFADGCAARLLEVKQEPSLSCCGSNPIEVAQLRTTAGTLRPFPLRRDATAEGIAVSPDGRHVVVAYVVVEDMPGQQVWGRFIAGPSPKVHSELWLSEGEGTNARCIYRGVESLYVEGWNAAGTRLLLSGPTGRWVIPTP